MRTGLDTAQDTSNSLLTAKTAGKSFVARYLWSGGKGLTLAEARAITAVLSLSPTDIPIALLYEAQAGSWQGGSKAGAAAGSSILQLLVDLGIEPSLSTCVYGIAVDQDVHWQPALLSYGQGMQDVLGGKLSVGIYGNGEVSEEALAAGVAQRAMLWGVNDSYGTAEFLASGAWSIHQHPTARLGGISEDPDDAQDEFGGCRVPVLIQPGDKGDHVRLLQQRVGMEARNVDGDFGLQTGMALQSWLAAGGFPAATEVDDELWWKIAAVANTAGA